MQRTLLNLAIKRVSATKILEHGRSLLTKIPGPLTTRDFVGTAYDPDEVLNELGQEPDLRRVNQGGSLGRPLALPREFKTITLIADIGAVHVDFGDELGGAKRVFEKFRTKIIY